MSDPAASIAAAAPVAAPRRASPNLALLLSLGALLLAGWASWLAWTTRGNLDAVDDARRAQGDLLARLERDSTEVARVAQTLERRLGDAEGVNQSVREEVLGLGERARLLEDAVARLAEHNLTGALQLRLNEAEFLLRMGQERLVLFDDAPATIAAFQLADAELAALEDPLFAGVRQTIATEIAALSAVPNADRSQLLARLDAVADALSGLPTRLDQATLPAPDQPAPSGWFDRAEATLAQFVRVRELAADDVGLINPLNAEAARASVAIELALAKAALLSGDEKGVTAAAGRARQQLAASFAVEQPAVQGALTAIDGVLAAPAQAHWPEIGGALAQLRNLRATRALAITEAAREPAPKPAP